MQTPPQDPSQNITLLLKRATDGGASEQEALIVAVYQELRRTAQSMINREASGHTLAATDLVHEAFFRLFGDQEANWDNRRHFFGSAAVAMRRVLVDHARRKQSQKRIPKEQMIPLEAAADVLDLPDVDLIALDEALRVLEKAHPRQAQIVELRFFAGLTESEVADLLQVSRMTISRDWKVARLRLLREMDG